MEFRLLGWVEAEHDGRLLALGRRRERCLLGILLLDAGRVVPADRLIDLLWDGDAPPSARGGLHTHIARLRSRLDAVTTDGQPVVRLVTRHGGYMADVDTWSVDAHRFTSQANRALTIDDAAERARLLREALALWRGPLLADVAGERLRDRLGAPLTQLRVSATEAMMDAELTRGRHGELIGELTTLVTEHPHQERFHAQLMLALYRAGRQPEALEVYERLRARLAEQLGVDPGPSVRELHTAILRQDRALITPDNDDTAPDRTGAGGTADAGGTGDNAIVGGEDRDRPRTVPAQLPADVANFTGRTGELAALERTVAAARDHPTAPVIVTVSGAAGAGKTALALRFAHRIRHRYPDGQLYLNLRGHHAGPPVRPVEALAQLLRSLGVSPEQIPTEPEQAATMYRSLLADRRMLLLLDNAGSSDQVRPLLPGAPGCLTLVTSRDNLSGLVARDGAHHLRLDVLTTADAHTLLTRLIGPGRVAAEPETAAELARLCGYLPLALRIAAAHLATRPGQGLKGYTEQLRADDRLAVLRVDGDPETAVATAFDLSYDRLTPAAQRMFRLLGLVPGPDVTAAAAAALAGLDVSGAGRLLTRLTDAHLLEQHTTDRYSFHDLLRSYAADRTAGHDSGHEREAALTRLYRYYLRTADRAANQLNVRMARIPASGPDDELPDRDTVAGGPDAAPPVPEVTFSDHSGALAWLDAERPNLVAAIVHTAAHGPRSVAWRLADTLRGYFWFRIHVVDWLASADAALAAAEADGHPAAQAAARLSLAVLYWRRDEYRRAIEHAEAARDLAERAGWLEGQAAALGNLGSLHQQWGHMAQVVDFHHRAMALHRQVTGPDGAFGRARDHNNLGAAYQDSGRLHEAAEQYAVALELWRDTGVIDGEAMTMLNLGIVRHNQGRFDEAREMLTRTAEIASGRGEPGIVASVMYNLAETLMIIGDRDDALGRAEHALSLARDTGNRRFEAEALNVLSNVRHSLGDHRQAVEHGQTALRIAHQTGNRHAETHAHLGLSDNHHRLGRLDRALGHAEDALALARNAGYRLLEGRALTALTAVRLTQHRSDQAVQSGEQALAVHRETGYRLGEAQTHLLLGRAHELRGDDEAATHHLRRAADLHTDLGLADHRTEAPPS